VPVASYWAIRAVVIFANCALATRRVVRIVVVIGFAVVNGFAVVIPTGLARTLRLAVASLAAAAGFATFFVVDFDLDWEAGLLLIKDFFVIAIVISPRNF
jgi:hypothetical protein